MEVASFWRVSMFLSLSCSRIRDIFYTDACLSLLNTGGHICTDIGLRKRTKISWLRERRVKIARQEKLIFGLCEKNITTNTPKIFPINYLLKVYKGPRFRMFW